MRRRQIRDPDETVISFLARELPPAGRDDAEFLAKAIKEAGKRYHRYDQRRAEWEKYSRRETKLRLAKGAGGKAQLYPVLS